MSALITLAEAKAQLGNLDEERLTGLIGAASELINVSIRRFLLLDDYEETLYQSGIALSLRGYPLASVQSVTASGSAVSGYIIDTERGLLLRGDGTSWVPVPGGYIVIYRGGLSEIPAPVKQACLMLVQQLQAAIEHGGLIASAERIGDYSITYLTNGSAGSGLETFSPAIAALIRPYMGRHL